MENWFEITGTEDFEARVLKSEKPVFVKFTAAWCAPCKALNPILHDLAKTYSDQMNFAEVDIDQNLELAKNFKVRGVPTTMVVRAGSVSHVNSGKKSNSYYQDLCKEVI